MKSERLYENGIAGGDPSTIAQIERVTWIGLAVNILLSGIKFVVGFVGLSQAVVADAVHSLSDLSTDLAVLFGVRLWVKPADEDHPYGHRRIETVVTAVISIVLFSVGIGIGYNALVAIRGKYIQQPGMIAFVGALISVICKEILYRWTFVVGKRIKSSAVMANAWHHRTDALSSIPVVIAVAVAAVSPQWSFLDRVGAVVVSLFILHAAWKIIRPALSELIDTGASKKERRRIRAVALDTPGVKSIHALRTRRMGSGLHVDLHIQVDSYMTVKEGHDISEIVKQKLFDEGPDVVDVVVHLEPYE